MALAKQTSPEQEILRARARGMLSCQQSFERFYALYARTVLAWMALRVERHEADGLFQDVWTTFYTRWQRWVFLPEMEAPQARPVLSFLYRTCQFILQGHRRRVQPTEPLEVAAEAGAQEDPDRLLRGLELGRCLALAKKVCSSEQIDVLTAKLAGVPAREISQTLGITESVVDHHFRNAIARVREHLAPRSSRNKQSKHA